MKSLPNFKVKTLKEAREELAKFGITSKVATIGQARSLLLAKRSELAKANKANLIADEATPTVATISKPIIAPVATAKAKAAQVAKPAVFDVANYLGLRMKQISSVWLNKSELIILSVSNDATACIEAAIETLSKSDYREGVLLSNAHSILQQHELTKNIDPRELLADIKASTAIKLESEKAQKGLANWRTSSN